MSADVFKYNTSTFLSPAERAAAQVRNKPQPSTVAESGFIDLDVKQVEPAKVASPKRGNLWQRVLDIPRRALVNLQTHPAPVVGAIGAAVGAGVAYLEMKQHTAVPIIEHIPSVIFPKHPITPVR